MERKSKGRRSVIDLYAEREREEWYWRALGTLAPVLILLGFLVFPTSFSVTNDTTVRNQSVLSIIAVVLLALGYSLSVALWFICRSWFFQFDILFLPCLISSLLGAANTGITLGVHPSSEVTWGPAPISSLALALSSSAIYAGLCLYTARKIQAVRSTSSLSSSPHFRDTESDTLISNEDAQRKQFGRLLNQSHRAFTDHSLASSGNNNTYHIGIPDETRLGRPSRETLNPHSATRGSSPPQSGTRSVSPYSSNSHLGHPAIADDFNYENTTAGQIGSLPPGAGGPGGISLDFPDAPRPLEGKAATLQAARDRTAHNQRSRERLAAQMASSSTAAGSTTLPPVIINSRRSPTADEHEQGIPLADRHPLEREAFIPGHSPKSSRSGGLKGADVYPGVTYRPDDNDDVGYGHEQPRFEIVEGGDVEFDLGRAGKRAVGNTSASGSMGVGTGGEGSRMELEARMPRDTGRESVFSQGDEGTWGRGMEEGRRF